MRIIILLIGLVVGLTWIGVEVRHRHKPASNVLFAFALLSGVLLVLAIFNSP